MTGRLYYDDAYTTAFEARIIERLVVDGRPAVVLDQTYFYPEGGGQPTDRGTIAGIEVAHVFTREGDSEIVHVLGADVPGDEVACEIEWPRRFDHMQHHTGQHILTQAFVQLIGANTIGFHLGAEVVTIDLDTPQIDPVDLDAFEDLANRVIFEDRPVAVRVIDPDQADDVRVRKMPDHLSTDGLRVVEVEGFDATACGGTHVARTGEIGLLKIIRLEKHGDETRVEFLCGSRALRDYRQKHIILSNLSTSLTCGYWEIDGAVERLRGDLKEARRELKSASKQLLTYEIARLVSEARPNTSGVRVIRAAFPERDAGDIRALASSLIEEPDTVVLFGVPGEKAQVIAARSENLPQDMNIPLKAALGVLGSERGGGRPEFCQGGGVPAAEAQIEAALDAAERSLFPANRRRGDS
jgi:alanyl-tRNA synthetase